MVKTENSLRINGRIFIVLLIVFSAFSTFFYWKYLSKKDLDRVALNSKIPNKEQTKGYISSDNCRSCHPSSERMMQTRPFAEAVKLATKSHLQ